MLTPFRRLVMALVALLTLSATACSTIDSTFTTLGSGSDLERVTIGTLRGQPHLFAPYYYQQFAPDVTIEVATFDSSPDIKNALVSGQIDFGVVGIPALLAGAAAGEDVRLLAVAADGGSGLVGTPDIREVEDLRGRTVGYPRGSSQEILLRLTLAAHGLDADRDVTLVNLPFSDMATSFGGGRIDAFLSAELGPSTAREKSGAVEIASPYETPVGKVNIGLGATQRTIDADPDMVEMIAGVHRRAVEYMGANRGDWQHRVAEQFSLDPDVTALAVANTWPRWEIDDEFRAQLAALADQMVRVGHIPTAPAIETFVHTS
ncbi:ABC transporter substrate-binding protein [Dietzia cercidiphylli]|uniref:SsuA/THI5-like domain-containing protein n=1 Tax=Dietzia cercidiphylli TaxID=498199 RepID=A0ABN2J9A9_9ACTN|nr:ABC transporter substrate-binding protein [Dietzia cercidiphylli]MBB1048305.1 ABC transporter substrate-binding protein [Dietzia cercidiphylli]